MRSLLLALILLVPFSAFAQDAKPATPTLFLIGDSTVRNGQGKGDGDLWGWGDVIGQYFDSSKITVKNRALGGRSSRTFITEGRWDTVLADVKPGDYVLMQFGHNDGGPLDGPKGRASIHGVSDETKEITTTATATSPAHPEVVHSYGWYIKKYITDTKAKGAVPIVLSPIPRNMWKEGRVNRADADYNKWANECAEATGVQFINLNNIIADHYDKIGEAKVGADYFTKTDHTHTSKVGAGFNAQCVIEGIQALKDSPLTGFVLEKKP